MRLLNQSSYGKKKVKHRIKNTKRHVNLSFNVQGKCNFVYVKIYFLICLDSPIPVPFSFAQIVTVDGD